MSNGKILPLNDGKVLAFSIDMLEVTLISSGKPDTQENPPEEYLDQAIAFFKRSVSSKVKSDTDHNPKRILLSISELANIGFYQGLWAFEKKQSIKQENKKTIPKNIELVFKAVKYVPTIEEIDSFFGYDAEAAN